MSERSVFGRLYRGETGANFVGRWRLWFLLSGALILAGVASLLTRGLNLGIDFEGGTVWEVDAGDASVEDARDAVADAGVADAEIQALGDGEGDVRLRVAARPEGDTAERQQLERDVSAALEGLTGSDIVDINSVGPSWGDEISSKAQRALAVFLVVITIYITLRFEWKMALATLAALVHDILVTVGVYSLFGFGVTPATVIAILTILGYSIYDGIVVFDRVDENAKAMAASGRGSYAEMVNRSLNEVLMRTLNTSITALLPILSLLVIGSFVLGAATLQEFALALFIGLASGAYSSIFIASPVLALLKEREPRYRAMRQRAEAGRGPFVPTGAARAAQVEELPEPVLEEGREAPDEAPVEVPTAAAPAPRRAAPPPRPRKKGKRR